MIMKRLIVCCDGTWQGLNSPDPTNVIKLAQIIKPMAQDGTPQLIYYQAGLGTGSNKIDKWTGGIFGWGIDAAIQSAYQFLCLNYEEEDEIYLFGFSRGAYTVRSLAGFIYCSGLLKRQHVHRVSQAYELYRDNAIKPGNVKAKEFRDRYSEDVRIKLVGCWDTVGKLGIPITIPLISNWTNAKYQFHDTQLNRKVDYALHAIAIDERRKAFDVTPMTISDEAPTKLTQAWFPGTHGCVGGGKEETFGLSDKALLWMLEFIDKLNLGLEFVDSPELIAHGGIKPNYEVAFDPKTKDFFALGGIHDRSLHSLERGLEDSDIGKIFFDTCIDVSAKYRWASAQQPQYRPRTLEPYQQWLDTFVR
jgi:uncharacterized protein (DUF2235 family)